MGNASFVKMGAAQDEAISCDVCFKDRAHQKAFWGNSSSLNQSKSMLGYCFILLLWQLFSIILNRLIVPSVVCKPAAFRS